MEKARNVRVVLYIRVSTMEQALEGYSIEEQKRRLIAYCKARGWNIVEILVDPGYSGSNLDRPGIQTLISHIRNYDMVLVYKLDRLSRSQRDTLYLIESVFLPNEVDFVSMSESFDTSTPFGRAVIGILSVFAQLEREQIKERTAMGRIARAKDGKRLGSRPPIGYDYDKDSGVLVVNEYEAAQIRLIFNLYIGTPDRPGIGYQAISDYMQEHGYRHKYGDWRHKHTVYTCLAQRTYLGESNYSNIRVLNTHEAIITPEVFDRAQEIRNTRESKHKGSQRSDHLLTGFVWCDVCGARCACIRRGDHIGSYYVCYSRQSANPTMTRDPNCSSKAWPKKELEAVIDYEVRNLIFDQAALGRLIRKKETGVLDPKDHGDVLRKNLENLDKQIERMMDLYQDGAIPVDLLNERIKKLYEDRERISATIKEESEKSDVSMVEEDARAYLDTLAEIWDCADIRQKREILSVLVDRIRISSDDTVKIDWAFL